MTKSATYVHADSSTSATPVGENSTTGIGVMVPPTGSIGVFDRSRFWDAWQRIVYSYRQTIRELSDK